MTKYVLALFFLLQVLTVSAGERTALLAAFAREDAAAEKVFDESMTTVELTAAAGNMTTVAGKQLCRALEWKLRRTEKKALRLKLLADYFRLGRELQTLSETPRREHGSLTAMRVYHRSALLQKQMTAVLMLDTPAEKRWKKLENASVDLKKHSFSLRGGRGEFQTQMYGRKETLEILLFPRDTFTFQRREFAVLRSDIPFAGNDDFSTVYLCEFVKGKLVLHTTCRFPLISDWKLKENTLTFFYQKQSQVIRL